MDAAFIEQLLNEDESSTLDFKRDQYKFASADDNEKSELLKDILGFANGWRRGEAFILIGVEEVVGGRSTVFGITEHLADHSVQQFVNSLTNRPIRFGYETCTVDGKQLGVIRIDNNQHRPFHLKKDFGKLHKDWVYVRRGTSTDLGKPASPDEIARMGAASVEVPTEADLAVAFAEVDRESVLGPQISWSAERCDLPEYDDIPNYTVPRRRNALGIDLTALDQISLREAPNEAYYQEVAKFEFATRVFRKVRFVISNTGKVAANNVRVELLVPTGKRISLVEEYEMPDKPCRTRSLLDPVSNSVLKGIRPARRAPGDIDITTDDDRFKLEIDCKDMQPGRKVFSECFYIGIGETGSHVLKGQLFASNLSQPKEVSLQIDANITETSMSVDELVAFAKNLKDGDEDEE